MSVGYCQSPASPCSALLRPRFSPAWSMPAPWYPFLRDTPAHTRGPNPFARLPNHLIRLEEEGRGEGEAERLGGLEVDNQLELMGALHRQVGRCGAFQDFVHKDRRALALVVSRHAIAQQDPRRGIVAPSRDGRQP